MPGGLTEDAYAMKTTATLALAVGSTLALAPAAGARDGQRTLCERAAPIRKAVVKKHGARAPGRDICENGVLFKRGRHRGETHPPSTRQKVSYLRQLRRLNSPPPPMLVRTAVPPRRPPAGTASPGVAAPGGGTLDRIAQCESGGNPGTDTGNGFYGKYQFTMGTWASVGGSGNPAAASEAEQDRRAARLYAQRGAQPWPVCGR